MRQPTQTFNTDTRIQINLKAGDSHEPFINKLEGNMAPHHLISKNLKYNGDEKYPLQYDTGWESESELD